MVTLIHDRIVSDHCLASMEREYRSNIDWEKKSRKVASYERGTKTKRDRRWSLALDQFSVE